MGRDCQCPLAQPPGPAEREDSGRGVRVQGQGVGVCTRKTSVRSRSEGGGIHRGTEEGHCGDTEMPSVALGQQSVACTHTGAAGHRQSPVREPVVGSGRLAGGPWRFRGWPPS